MLRNFMAWMIGAAALLAAEALPAVGDREAAVMRILRGQVFPAEVQFRGGGYQDADGNRVGEFAFLAQLAGRAGTSRLPLGDRPNTGMRLLQEPLADGRTAFGYTFAAVLPGGGAGLLVEADVLPATGVAGAAHRERSFAVLAWPTPPEPGARTFLLMPDGGLRASDTHGAPPDPAQAIAYDPAAGTWTTAWRSADPRAMLAAAKAAAAAGDLAGALAQIDWLWRHSATVDPSLLGVRGSDMRDVYAGLAVRYPPAMQAYRAHLARALERALADTTDPAAAAGTALPANHLAFLDYVSLAERVETAKDIVAAFRRLDAVNHKLAIWEFAAVARFLAATGEFAYMSGFVPPFTAEAERSFDAALVEDYRLVRMGVMKPEHLMPGFIGKLALYQLVYQRNARTTDSLMLDAYVKMRLTDEEAKAMAGRIGEARQPEF